MAEVVARGPASVAVVPPGSTLPPEIEIDREKMCPMLIRVFPQFGGHHRLEDYARRGYEPKDEVQIYTWPDATLRELTDLVKEVQPAARRTTARLEFALIYPDKKGRNVMRVIGGAHSSRPGPDDIKTLKQLNFQFLLVPDKKGRIVMRLIGDAHTSQPGPDDIKTPKQLNLQTGDFLDVAIF